MDYGKIMGCEISFIPIKSNDYINEINEVLAIIAGSGLSHTVGAMSTAISGDKERLFSLIQEIYTKMEDKTLFSMQLKLSNICGCSK
ncbi:MAG: hypothetical protein HC831_26240 [Chloroflexia bacterium]|nr:hypothetical protein [Chloroflexia bacterium]